MTNKEPREVLLYGKKNKLTQLSQYVFNKVVVRKGYILHPSINSVGWRKNLRPFMR